MKLLLVGVQPLCLEHTLEHQGIENNSVVTYIVGEVTEDEICAMCTTMMMNMENHLQKFDDEAVRQAEEAKRYHQAEKDEAERVRQEIRRAQINKLQRNAGFMEEWLQKGVEDWKQNMSYKKERE